MSGQGVGPELLRTLLDVSPDVTSLTDRELRTALQAAIEGWKEPETDAIDHYELTVDCPLETFPRAILIRDNNGKTPLSAACEKNVPTRIVYRLLRMNLEGSLNRLGHDEDP